MERSVEPGDVAVLEPETAQDGICLSRVLLSVELIGRMGLWGGDGQY